MNNTKENTKKVTIEAVTIDQKKFCELYFKNEGAYSKIIRNLFRHAMSIYALACFENGIATYDMVEDGEEYYEKEYYNTMRTAMRELCKLSSISKAVYGRSMINGHIDPRNKKECYRLVRYMIDIFYNNMGIDIFDRNEVWKIMN